MNAQRYTPEELETIADQLRDEAIKCYMLELPGEPARGDYTYQGVCSHIEALTNLARLLHQDAERLRRNARAAQTQARPSAS